MFNEELCNCYLPDVEKQDYYCNQLKKERAVRENDRRNYPEYIEWRNSVFTRDDYTCQKCSARGGSIEAHHIKSYKKHPKLRIDINNGITLCKKCHRDVHKRGGANVGIGA